MKPRRYQGYAYRVVRTWLGPIIYVARGNRLVALRLPNSPFYQPNMIWEEFPGVNEDKSLLDDFAEQVRGYFEGRTKTFSIALECDGSPFRRRVLQAARRIPFGATLSYKGLAERCGNAMAARAVGQVLATNDLPLVIPCHRVLASDGTLGGFSCGLEVKRKLLEHEKRFST